MTSQEINKLRKDIINSSTFCFYPFVQLSTNPAGHIKPCCNYIGPLKSDETIVSMENGNTFDTAWNSSGMIQLRKKLVEEIIPSQCDRCIRDGESSMRVRTIKEYKNDYKTLSFVAETIKNNYRAAHLPSYLELKPNNLCNLKCVMCNAYDSSQISKELVQLTQKYKGITIRDGRFINITQNAGITEQNSIWNSNMSDVDWSDNAEIWENFTRIAPHLEVLSFAGGEPTIMPYVNKVLHYCVDNNYAHNIKIFISSNFTNLSKDFFELMPKFKKFELISSIDGYDKVNDYARYPSRWSQISKNYIQAKEFMRYPSVKMMTNITVNVLNIINLTDLLWWLEERAEEYPYFTEWPYNINLIYHPEEQKINMLPENLKLTATDRIIDYQGRSTLLKVFPEMNHFFTLLKNELSKPSDEKMLQLFVHRLKILDEHRNIKLTDYIPDLSTIY